MKLSAIILVALLLLPGTALALGSMYNNRNQADSEFRLAEKAYRKAIKEYGADFATMPAEEKKSACRKMSSALYDNRWQYNAEDAFTKPKYRNQVKKLERYSKALGCTDR